MRNAHSGISLSTTGDSQRSQVPSLTCSLAITVKQPVHQFTLLKRRYTSPRSSILMKNHWFQR